VKVQVLDANGKEVGTVDMGALKAGRYNFDWDAAGKYAGHQPAALQGAGGQRQTAGGIHRTDVDKVTAVSMDNGSTACCSCRAAA
jgi:flagellar basal-body rod modification protein FlgD